MEIMNDFNGRSKRDLLEYYSTSIYNSHFGRLIAKTMLERGYTYNDVARRAGLKDGTNVRVIVNGQRRDPYFSSIAKIAKALDLSIDKFLEDK